MIPFPDKKYSVIYADPAWDCPARAYSRGEALTDYYDTMPIEQIKELPVNTIADTDAWLYLWVVDALLPEGLEVCKAWGFTYKKSFIWNKIFFGLGNYNRGQHEQLLVGKRGNPSMPKLSDLQASVINVKRAEHSMKPYHFRVMIEKHHPNLPKIELFAREHFEGWDAWGNEVS